MTRSTACGVDGSATASADRAPEHAVDGGGPFADDRVAGGIARIGRTRRASSGGLDEDIPDAPPAEATSRAASWAPGRSVAKRARRS